MDKLKLVTAIFIGRSGCGKGTQASLLIDYLKQHAEIKEVLFVETGALFRDLIDLESFTWRHSREIMEKGELQPSFISTWIWAGELINKMTGREHLVIDGSPRKLGEAYSMASALAFYERPERPRVFHLNVTRDTSRTRLLDRKRADDSVVDVERRLNWFDAEVAPVIEFFKNDERFIFEDIDGERSVEDIHQDIISRLHD